MAGGNSVPEHEVLVKILQTKSSSFSDTLSDPSVSTVENVKRSLNEKNRFTGNAPTCSKRVLRLVIAEIWRSNNSILIFLVILGKLGGDVYVVFITCVYVFDGARILLSELFIDISNISVLVRAASGLILSATTASSLTAWSTAAA